MARNIVIPVKIPVTTGNFAQKLINLRTGLKTSVFIDLIVWGSTVIDLASTTKIHINTSSQSAHKDYDVPTTKFSEIRELATALKESYPKYRNLHEPIEINSNFYVGAYVNNYASNPTIYALLFCRPSPKKLQERFE